MNKEKKVAIQLSNVKKVYRLGQIGGGSLQSDLQSWWARKRGKEDPNIKVGMNQRLIGQTFSALNGINLTVYKGEAVGIIGANGAGKSTLLKLLSRVTAPTEGEIDIYGRVASMLEVGTGFNGEMTGRENIYMNGAILGMTKSEIDKKMDEIIEFSECGEFIDTPVKRYSSGMYVKLAFSVAAHLDSEIMIMDEVLAVGDMKFQKKCLGRMGSASMNEGRTILYVSHNMSTIRQFCTRCIVMNQGKIVYDGDVEEAISIYMETSMSVLETRFDISNIYQKYLSPKPIAKMMTVEFVGVDVPIYDYSQRIVFDLSIYSRVLTSSLSLRFEIRAADGSSIGTSFIFDSLHSDEDTLKTYRLEFDSNGLVPGKYSVVLGLFEKNSLGTYTDIDVVEKAMTFEIRDDDNHLDIMWLKGFWGNIKLKDLKIV